MHADGAGTKSSLAYMYWKETGDVSVWRGIAQVCASIFETPCRLLMHSVSKNVHEIQENLLTCFTNINIIHKHNQANKWTNN